MKYNIHLQVYDGPLDLLYDMISKQKIDIKDISISEITKQYLSYLNMLEKMDLEITSEFITMASKLLQIKSKYLLYKQKDNEEEEDPRLELMEKLEEYKKYKLASQDIKSNVTDLSEVFYRKKEEIIIDDKVDLDDISIEAIKMILPQILKIKKVEEDEPKDERLSKIVKGRIVSVEEKMEYIRNIIKEKNSIGFVSIIERCDKNEVIATFLSILELIKAKEIIVEQNIFFDDILIKRSSERENETRGY
ncbi:MAG: segregation and condensation protein A [Peptostreptococcaceae bacterium]